jgi:hypothetical protein
MYTGTTEQPCCLCGDRETVARLAVPPRAVQLMRNGDPVAWRDIVGEVTVFFCANDWELVGELVADVGVNPLSRCNVARASFSIREDYEALLSATRSEPDQTGLEERLLARSDEVIEQYGEDPMVERRDFIEARVTRWALEELGVADGADADADA